LAGTGVPPLLAKSENIYQRKIHTNKKNIPGVSSFWQAPVCHDCSLKRKSYKIHTNKKHTGGIKYLAGTGVPSLLARV
jgi:hypothetical protein